jgi:hypothetical protein
VSDDEFLKDFWAREQKDPLLKQYVNHISRPGRNCEPWHALGQRRHAAGACAGAMSDERIPVEGLRGDAPRASFLRHSVEWILNAAPFLWSNATERIADAAPLPKHIVSPNVLPYPTMFWTFETAGGSRNEAGSFVETNWTAIRHNPDGVMMMWDLCEVDDTGEPVKQWGLSVVQIPYGWTWPDDFQKLSPEISGVARFLKRCAFLASPYVSKEKTRLARHHRRQMQRAGEPTEKVEEEVSVVKLRREVKQRTDKAAEQSTSIEWQHQWWVSGHYRAQWYPHEEAHRVIWIAPYLKGPSDKPVLEKVYAVVR